jgi:hypothetical protein
MEIPHQITGDIVVKYFLYAAGAFGGVSAILIAIAGFVGKGLLQKFTYALQNKNNKEIESLKALITQNNNKELEVIKAAITQNNAFVANMGANHSATYQKVISKRIEVVEYYWQCILKAKDTTPGTVNLIYQIMTDAEITVEGINSAKGFRDELPKISLIDSSIELSKQSVEIDLRKPFISSKMWVLKYAYMAILGRSVYLLLDGYKRGSIKLWKQDEMVLQSMQLVLTEAEIEYATNKVLGGLNHVLGLIENKMIDEISRFLSNDDFANDSADQFKKIDKLIKKDVGL